MRIRTTAMGAAVAVAAALAACHGAPDFRDQSLTPAERADALLAQLTLEEKVSLMGNSSPAIPRLGIDEYDWWNEALHGVGRAGLATVFPQSIGMAASWDTGLLLDVFNAVSDEARAKNNDFASQGSRKRYQGLTFWTPNVNIFRDPRWGRGQETYGEDPFLAGQMGMRVVRGLQGPDDARHDKLHACAKHFAVHSGPEWSRHSFDAEGIEPRDLWETYLPAFRDLVTRAGVREVMCAYNRYEGEPCCGSNRLLQQILRDEWGFQGIVLSDCWALSDFYSPAGHHTDPDTASASAHALRAGTDLECGDSYPSLVQAVSRGLVGEDEIDRSARRLIEARVRLGEWDDDVEWRHIPITAVASPGHRDLALRMAQESVVMLQNRGALPLKPGARVALVGPNAADSVMQWGNYNGFPAATSTLLSALRQRLGDDRVIYEPGCDHLTADQLESLFGECEADGRKGFRATFWNKRRPGGQPDATAHFETPLALTTAGATVWAPGVSLDNFAAQFETTFRPARSGQVTFAVQTIGGVTLDVDGQTVASGRDMKSNRFHTMQVEAGRAYSIRLSYYDPEGSCALLNFDLGVETPADLDATVARAAQADVIIFAGGISPLLEGEETPVSAPGFRGGDREAIEPPAVQTRLVEMLARTGKPVVLVNFTGSAVALTREAAACDAILQAWYPGERGGEAIASILTGDCNPSGRLPVTFYASTTQLPDFEDYSMRGRTYRYMSDKPLFPFGHGLSYTTFDYSPTATAAYKAGRGVTISFDVTNTGQRDGDEVAQVYLRRPGDTDGPDRALRGFARVSVPAGQTRRVDIDIEPRDLEWFDTETNTMHIIPGHYQLLYGGTSDPELLRVAEVEITGD